MAAAVIDRKHSQRSIAQVAATVTPLITSSDGHPQQIENAQQTVAYDNDSLEFHPLKSYKTGKITESSLSMIGEGGSGTASGSDSKKFSSNFCLSKMGKSDCLAVDRPLRSSKSKSTLDLPSASNQDDELLEEERVRVRKSKLDQRKKQQQYKEEDILRKRHKSAYSQNSSVSVSPSVHPRKIKSMPTSVFYTDVEVTDNISASHDFDDGNSSNNEVKLKRNNSFRVKPKLKREEMVEESPQLQPQLQPAAKLRTTKRERLKALLQNVRNSGSYNDTPLTSDQLDSSDGEAIPELPSRKEKETRLVAPLPSMTSESIDSVEAVPPTIPTCPVDHEDGKKVLTSVISCSIDQLFIMLFTNSSFYLGFQAKRKTTDLKQTEWLPEDAPEKARKLTFTALTGQTIGPKTVNITETQTLLAASRPGLLYAVQSETVNAGIPYADCFVVNCHICLSKRSNNECNLIVVSKIKYLKSTWAKTFIDKNTMSALSEYFCSLEKAVKEECLKMPGGGGKGLASPSIAAAASRIKGKIKAPKASKAKGRAPDIPPSGSLDILNPNMSPFSRKTKGGGDNVIEKSLIMKIIMAALGFLLLLNIFLHWKLYSLESAASNMSTSYTSTLQFTGEPPQTHQEWLLVIQQQEAFHQSEASRWQETLAPAIQILQQAEKDLEKLRSHIASYSTDNMGIAVQTEKPNTRGVGAEYL